MYCLNSYPLFIQYKKFNCLDSETIRQSTSYFRYKHYKKGTYIFHKFSKSEHFYGIIRGAISIRGINYKQSIFTKYDEMEATCPLDKVNTIMFAYEQQKPDINNTPEQLRYDLEYEKVLFKPGMCFGEWGIVNKTYRSASAYCVEDTDVFYLEKEFFNNFYCNLFYNSVSSKKRFLNTVLNGLGKYFAQIVPRFYNYGDIVYTMNDQARFMYVIYQGECSFFDNIIPGEHEHTNVYASLKRDNFKVKTILTQGCLVGMESVVYFGKKNIKYKDNVIALQDYTVVYELNIDLLYNKGCFLFDAVMPLYKAQKRVEMMLKKKKEDVEKIVKKRDDKEFTEGNKDKCLHEEERNENKRKKVMKKIYIQSAFKKKFVHKHKKINTNTTQTTNNNNNECEINMNHYNSNSKSKNNKRYNENNMNYTCDNSFNDKYKRDAFITSFSPSNYECKSTMWNGVHINVNKNHNRNIRHHNNNNNNSEHISNITTSYNKHKIYNIKHLSTSIGIGNNNNKAIISALRYYNNSFLKYKHTKRLTSHSPDISFLSNTNSSYNSGHYELPFVHSLSSTNAFPPNSIHHKKHKRNT